MKTVNFIFIRHGESCQQVAYNMRNRNSKVYKKLYHLFSDPTLSDEGVLQSINAGSDYNNRFKNKFNIDSFDIIGCSPMLRSIETAYYMTLDYNPDNIQVYPFLRECHKCYGEDTGESLNKIWPMRSIEEQKTYLSSVDISNINFNYVKDNNDRESPGDIETFLNWFSKNIELTSENTNVLIITHSHVLQSFKSSVSPNNAGIYFTTEIDNDKNIKYNKANIQSIWPKEFRKQFTCPEDGIFPKNPRTRCKEICEKDEIILKE